LYYLMDKGRCVAEGEMNSLPDDLIKKYLAV